MDRLIPIDELPASGQLTSEKLLNLVQKQINLGKELKGKKSLVIVWHLISELVKAAEYVYSGIPKSGSDKLKLVKQTVFLYMRKFKIYSRIPVLKWLPQKLVEAILGSIIEWMIERVVDLFNWNEIFDAISG